MTAPAPATQTLSGKTDDRFVGVWNNTTDPLVLTLNADGSSTVVGSLNTGRGEFKMDVKGQWRVDGQTLLLENEQKGGKAIESYNWKLVDAEHLDLSRKFPKSVLHYVKKK